VDRFLIDSLSKEGWTRTLYSLRLGTGDLEYDNGNARVRVKHSAKRGTTLLEMQPKNKGRIHLQLHLANSPEPLVEILLSWQARLDEASLPSFVRDIHVAYPDAEGDRTGSGEWAPLGLDD
jgi:hypothetical protein